MPMPSGLTWNEFQQKYRAWCRRKGRTCKQKHVAKNWKFYKRGDPVRLPRATKAQREEAEWRAFTDRHTDPMFYNPRKKKSKPSTPRSAIAAIKARAGEPVTHRQAMLIGRSAKVKRKSVKTSWQKMLAAKGLTRGTADKVIKAMIKDKCLHNYGEKTSPAKVKKAKAILARFM